MLIIVHFVITRVRNEDRSLKICFFDNFLGRQCSSRGGELTVRVREDGRVDLAGKAQTFITGVINI